MTYPKTPTLSSSALPCPAVLYCIGKHTFGASIEYKVFCFNFDSASSLTERGALFDEPTFEQFSRLTEEWKEATCNLSSIHQIESDPSYRKILSMGPRVIPFILRSMKAEPYFWFSALRTLTKENPVPDKMRGNIKAMTQAWLGWGKKNGYR